MLTSIDLFLICLAVLIMIFGFLMRVRVLKHARQEACSGSWKFLLKYLIGHKKILKNNEHFEIKERLAQFSLKNNPVERIIREVWGS